MAENDEVDSKGGDCKNNTVKKLLSKNSNRALGYLISNAKQTFTQ